MAWLSKKTWKPYRLLTEAEWEYATRADTTTRYFWGEDIGKGNANCRDCGSQWGGKQTSPVGSFKPNAFGLYDMHGNVAQWVEDCWHENYQGAPADGSAWTNGYCREHVIRGGTWAGFSENQRAAVRGRIGDDRGAYWGFRVARRLTPPERGATGLE